MIISTIIPTFNREHLLTRAVESVLSQDVTGADTEVIVVNDAQDPLHRASWQESPCVTVINTCQKERCIARNAGAALARGKYLHFLDDDDTLLPGGLAALLDVAESTDAAFAFGSYEALIDDGAIVNVVRPIAVGNAYAVLVAGLGIPLGAGLLRSDAFWSAGGFDLSFTIMEDMELLQRVSMSGRFVGTEAVVAKFSMGSHTASTTAWDKGSEACRRQREKAFCHPNCLASLVESLREHRSPELRGFLVRYYFGSAFRNVSGARVLAAISRIAAGLALCGPGLPRARFWAAACGRESPVIPGLVGPR